MMSLLWSDHQNMVVMYLIISYEEVKKDYEQNKIHPKDLKTDYLKIP